MSRPLVCRPKGGAHQSSAIPLGRDHHQGLHKGCLIFQHRFGGRIWGIDCWKTRWMNSGRRGGYGFGISFAGHGLKMMGCCWDQWRFLRNRWEQGREERVLGFLEERYENSFSSRMPSSLTDLSSRWVKEVVHRSWTTLGLAQVRPTRTGPQWAPACAGQQVGSGI